MVGMRRLPTPLTLDELTASLDAAWGRPGRLPHRILDVLRAGTPRTFAELRAATGAPAVSLASALWLLEREELVESGTESGRRLHALSSRARRLRRILGRIPAAARAAS